MVVLRRLLKRVTPRRSHVKRLGLFLLKLIVVCAVLGALLVGIGFAYVWYTGQQPNLSSTNPPAPTAPTRPTISRPKPNPKAPVSASIQLLSSPVKVGDKVSLTVRTTPKARCTVTVEYENDIKSTATGLKPVKANEFGMADWTWTVEPTAPRGTWPVEAECTAYKKSAMVRGDLEIK